jgi:hypothetical protein
MRLRSLAPIAASLLLLACHGDEVRPIAPPTASIQKLAVNPDGALALELRVQNFGKKAAHFASLDATLKLDGAEAGAIHAPIGFDIPPRNSEVVKTTVALADAAARARLGAGAHELRYAIKGEIVTDKPSARYRFEYESTLSPVPGVQNEYR